MQTLNAEMLKREAGLMVVAHWQAKPGEEERVAQILGRFLPEAGRNRG